MPIKQTMFGRGGGNYILQNDDVLVSYQPWKEVSGSNNMFEIVATAITGDDTVSDETALMCDDTWYILKGDWRKEYEKLFPDKKKCIAFYKKMKPKHGFDKWSTDE